MNHKKTPLIYILSSADSGSTLLSLILGAHPQICSLGELLSLNKLWLPRGKKTARCSCALQLRKCPFWNEIAAQLYANCGKRLGALGNPASQHSPLITQCLLCAAAEVSGKSVLCDSSKCPQRLERLAACKNLDILIVHLVRDGRAVACSAYRKNTRRKHSVTHRTHASLGRTWSTVNRRYVSHFGSAANYLLLRYEDLVTRPQLALQPVLARMGLEYQPKQSQWSSTVQHLIGGNQVRFTGDSQIRPDVRHFAELNQWNWWRVTYAARRGLTQFGYPLLKSAAPLYAPTPTLQHSCPSDRAAA